MKQKKFIYLVVPIFIVTFSVSSKQQKLDSENKINVGLYDSEFNKNEVLKSYGLREFSIKRDDGSDIIFYHSTLDLDNKKKKPLWIQLQGSGCHALFSLKRKM